MLDTSCHTSGCAISIRVVALQAGYYVAQPPPSVRWRTGATIPEWRGSETRVRHRCLRATPASRGYMPLLVQRNAGAVRFDSCERQNAWRWFSVIRRPAQKLVSRLPPAGYKRRREQPSAPAGGFVMPRPGRARPGRDCEHRPAGGRWPSTSDQEHLSLRCRAGSF